MKSILATVFVALTSTIAAAALVGLFVLLRDMSVAIEVNAVRADVHWSSDERRDMNMAANITRQALSLLNHNNRIIYLEAADTLEKGYAANSDQD